MLVGWRDAPGECARSYEYLPRKSCAEQVSSQVMQTYAFTLGGDRNYLSDYVRLYWTRTGLKYSGGLPIFV